MDNVKALAAKLVNARRNLRAVKKTGKNTFQKYDYYTQEDIDNAVRPLLDAEGVVLLTTVTGYQYESDGKFITCQMEFLFIDSESGESVSTTYFGIGKGTDDKGLYAAYTGAYKYGIMKTFGLSETADEVEHDSNNKPDEKPNGAVSGPKTIEPKDDRDKRITQEQYKDLVARFHDNGWKNSTVKAYLASKGYEKGTDIKRRDYMAISIDADQTGVRLQFEGNEEVTEA